MAATWYVKRSGRRSGPYTPAQLKELVAAGRLQPTDMVFSDGMTQPVPATKVKGLFPATPPALSQVSHEDPGTPNETPGPGPAPLTETPATLRGKFSALPGWQKGVAFLGVVMTGFCLFSCVVGIILNLAGVKPSGGGGTVASTDQGKGGANKTTQVRAKGGKVVIKHEPYTQIVMPPLPDSRVHEVSEEDYFKTKYGKLKPVARVADVTQIDFIQGPDGEPVEMDRVKWQDGVLRTEAYFYKDKEGRKVFHGTLTSFGPRGDKQSETIYIYGTMKFSQSFSDGQNLIPEVYRGDDDHKGVTYTLFANKSMKSVYPYYKKHNVTETEDKIQSVGHGRELIFWDNTVLMRNIKLGATELAKDIGGVRTEYTWEHGKRVRRREFKRNGEVSYDGK